MTDPRLTLWDWVRSNLRDATLHNQLDRMERHVATAAEQINALSAKVDDVAADFRAFRDAMNAERENLTAAGQAALDDANARLSTLDTEVGDADGSDTPAPPVEPTEPNTFR